MIDGYEVKVNDELYDWYGAKGVVTQIDVDKSIIVAFANRKVRYNSDGSKGQGTRSELFWQNMSLLPRPRPGVLGKKEMEMLANIAGYIREALDGDSNAKS